MLTEHLLRLPIGPPDSHSILPGYVAGLTEYSLCPGHPEGTLA
jgi:hypothetical protein